MTKALWTGLAGVLLLAATVVAQKPEAAETLLQTAIKKEVVDGNLAGAIEAYKKVAQTSDKAIAAKALLRLAECYQKLGDKEATNVYERLARDFASQPEAAEARAKLAMMRASASNEPANARLVARNLSVYRGGISQDGTFAAISLDGEHIGIRDLTTGRIVRQLQLHGNRQDDVGNIVLSPDASQIAYTLDPDTPDHDNHPVSLRVVANEAGAKPRVLVSNPEIGYLLPSAWSADSKRLLTAIERKDLTWQIAWVSVADGSVTVQKSLDWRFGYGLGLSLSPDGRYIAYAARAATTRFPPTAQEQGDTRIYVLPADGNGAEIELVRTTGRNSSPIWTADGNHVLFKSDRTGSVGVWAVPVSDGKAAGPAARVISVNLTPIAATRTGTSYYLTESNDQSVSIVESTGQRGAPDRIAGTNPMWSPDGKSIALLRRNSAGVFANRFDLIVHSLDSGEEKRFAREGIHGAAVWYRDGRSLLIAAGAALYRVDVTTGEFKEVLPSVADEYRGDAVLSADEKTLYFVARSATKWAIVAADLTTRQERDVLVLERPVARDGRNVRSLFLSPNGKSIAFGWRDYDAQLQHVDSVDVDGTHHREVATIPQSQPMALFGWSRDGGALEFLDQQGRIMRMPAIGGTGDFTGVKLAVERFAAARPSPDGTRFAVATSGEVSELWAIDNIPALLKARR